MEGNSRPARGGGEAGEGWGKETLLCAHYGGLPASVLSSLIPKWSLQGWGPHVGVFLTSWDGLFETEQVCGFTLRKLIFTF